MRRRGSGPRTSRRPDGHRVESHPLGPLSVARSRTHPRRGARRTSRDGVRRGTGGRSARGRRGDAPRLAELRGVRSPARPRAAPFLGPLGDLGRRAGSDASGPRARRRRDERPRCLQPADRRIRRDDDPGRQPAPPAAPRAAARTDVAAARGRRAAGRDRRHRRVGIDRPGRRCARDRVRVPGGRGPPLARPVARTRCPATRPNARSAT